METKRWLYYLSKLRGKGKLNQKREFTKQNRNGKTNYKSMTLGSVGLSTSILLLVRPSPSVNVSPSEKRWVMPSVEAFAWNWEPKDPAQKFSCTDLVRSTPKFSTRPPREGSSEAYKSSTMDRVTPSFAPNLFRRSTTFAHLSSTIW